MLLLGIIDVPLWLILTIFFIISMYWYGTRNHKYFEKRGIPGPKPWPFIGINPRRFNKNLYTQDADDIREYGKVFGSFLGNSPQLFIADHDMLSEITIKQFHNFTGRRPMIIRDKVFQDNLVDIDSDHWKSVRSHMSPTFTTGKLRRMSKEINRCAKSFSDRLKSIGEPFEIRQYVQSFTMDCIASTAFGIRTDTQKDVNNEFNTMGKRLMSFSIKSFIFFFSLLAPTKLKDVLEACGVDLRFLDKTSTDFFTNVIDQTIQGRSAGDKTRVDFIQLMVNAYLGENIEDQEEHEEDQDQENPPSASHKRKLTKNEILSNSFLFFFAGYETAAIALTQITYALACNRECQNKVLEEVDREIGDVDEVTYDAINKLQYLDQCINETLRLYPPAFATDRRTTHTAEVCGLKIEEGMIIIIPILAIHKDPEIWPDPEKFDPDRFNPERKASIKPTHFMPFGIGPRNCIGMRQALFEIKTAVVQILKTHKLVTCEKTEIPLTMSKTKMWKAENGVWIALEKR